MSRGPKGVSARRSVLCAAAADAAAAAGSGEKRRVRDFKITMADARGTRRALLQSISRPFPACASSICVRLSSQERDRGRQRASYEGAQVRTPICAGRVRIAAQCFITCGGH